MVNASHQDKYFVPFPNYTGARISYNLKTHHYSTMSLRLWECSNFSHPYLISNFYFSEIEVLTVGFICGIKRQQGIKSYQVKKTITT